MSRYDLTDFECRVIKPLLPICRSRGGLTTKIHVVVDAQGFRIGLLAANFLAMVQRASPLVYESNGLTLTKKPGHKSARLIFNSPCRQNGKNPPRKLIISVIHATAALNQALTAVAAYTIATSPSTSQNKIAKNFAKASSAFGSGGEL